jgi:hypothetical protein
MDPTRAENALAPGPEALPRAMVHTANQPEAKALKPAQHFELLRTWVKPGRQ